MTIYAISAAWGIMKLVEANSQEEGLEKYFKFMEENSVMKVESLRALFASGKGVIGEVDIIR